MYIDKSRLSNLYTLTMDRNKFIGTIPESFGQLRNMIFLSFGDNAFTGTLPVSMVQLTRLGMCFRGLDNIAAATFYTIFV